MTTNKWFYLFLFLCLIGDTVTTYIGTLVGGTEVALAFTGNRITTIIATKVVLLALFAYIYFDIEYKKPEMIRTVIITFCGFYMGIIFSNILQIMYLVTYNI